MTPIYAVVAEGHVVNVIVWDGVTPFDPGDGRELVAAPDGAGIGWRYVDGQFVAPPVPVPSLADRLAQVAERRWIATQAFTFDGVRTQADGAIAVVTATLTMRTRRGVPPEIAQPWKLADGEFRFWNEAQIEAFGFAIADHVQACFNREAELSAALAGPDPSAVDIESGWPS